MAAPRPRLSPALLGGLVLLMAWQGASWLIASPLILPGPWPVLKAMGLMASGAGFWLAVGGTALRTAASFVLGLALAIPLGLGAGYHQGFRAFIAPGLIALRATPVISVIILGLIWFSPSLAPLWVCLLMIIPMLVQSLTEGVQARDPGLHEMARAFRVSRTRTFMTITLPGLVPFIRAGSRAALGVGWKVVAAAEVLSMPDHGLGSLLQNSRTWLQTDRVLAATVYLVILSGLTDLLLDRLLTTPGPVYKESKTELAPEGGSPA